MATTDTGVISLPLSHIAAPEMLAQLKELIGDTDVLCQEEVMGLRKGTRDIKFFYRDPIALGTVATTPEGTDPAAVTPNRSSLSATVGRYADVVEITKDLKLFDLYDIWSDSRDDLTDLAARKIEYLKLQTLVGATQIRYANGAATSAVNTLPTLDDFQYFENLFRRNKVPKVATGVKAGTGIGTKPARASHVAFIHPDLDSTIRGMAAIGQDQVKLAEDYGSSIGLLSENEIATVCGFRVISNAELYSHVLFNSGGAKGTTRSQLAEDDTTAGTLSDVYPIIFGGASAVLLTALSGVEKVKSMVAGKTKEVKYNVSNLKVYLTPPEANVGSPTRALGTIAYDFYRAQRLGRPECSGVLWCAAPIL